MLIVQYFKVAYKTVLSSIRILSGENFEKCQPKMLFFDTMC